MQSRFDRRSTGLGPVASFFVFGGLAVVAIGLVLWGILLIGQHWQASSLDASLTFEGGSPTIRSATESGWRSLVSGAVPRPGDELNTRDAARTELVLAHDTTLRLGVSTHVRIESAQRADGMLEVRLRLMTGRLWAENGPKERITVVTDVGDVTFEGQAGEVESDAEGTRLLAWRGAMRVRTLDDRPRAVASGRMLVLPVGGKGVDRILPHDQDPWQKWNLQALDGREHRSE
jgi:hypothetical protein